MPNARVANEMGVSQTRFRMTQSTGAAKRGFDLAIAMAGLIVAMPLMLAIALCIRFTMGAPILFRQTRPGLQRKPFTILKFRTMKDGPQSDTDRITKLGAFLRRTSLDELPELWNVLWGDMSLVGPRPLLMEYLERYSQQQMRRHEVLPGITGWAQINGRNALCWEKRLAFDVWYVDHHSFWLDAKILVRSVCCVVSQSGITHPQHSTMPPFLGALTPETRAMDASGTVINI